MPKNHNTDSESPLDAQDFDIVFEPYGKRSSQAFILAQHLDCIKEFLERGPKGIRQAISGIDLAIERLYEHTDFNEAAYKLYLLALRGKILIQEDPREILRKMEGAK